MHFLQGAIHLAGALGTSTSLTELDVSSCSLSPVGAFALMCAAPGLQSLHLDGNVLPLHLHLAAGMEWSLVHCPLLSNLSLFNCALGKGGAMALCLSLPEMARLKKLHRTFCLLTRAYILLLISSFPSCCMTAYEA